MSIAALDAIESELSAVYAAEKIDTRACRSIGNRFRDAVKANSGNPELPAYLDRLAKICLVSPKASFFDADIAIAADAYGIMTENIRLLAGDILLSSASTPQEVQVLDAMFPDDETLKRNSKPITDEEWAHMQDFAKQLKQYI